MFKKFNIQNTVIFTLVLVISLSPIASNVSASNQNSQTVTKNTYEIPPQQEFKDFGVTKNNLESAQPASIAHLLKAVFKVLVRNGDDVVVTATKRNVQTTIRFHFMEQAIARGITELAVDNLLSEKAAGMNAVEKYDDTIGNSRIMYDPDTKLTLIISKNKNILVTTYKDDDNEKAQRIKSGRWVRSYFIYK